MSEVISKLIVLGQYRVGGKGGLTKSEIENFNLS